MHYSRTVSDINGSCLLHPEIFEKINSGANQRYTDNSNEYSGCHVTVIHIILVQIIRVDLDPDSIPFPVSVQIRAVFLIEYFMLSAVNINDKLQSVSSGSNSLVNVSWLYMTSFTIAIADNVQWRLSLKNCRTPRKSTTAPAMMHIMPKKLKA